jgi:3-hydroxyisobutyrate dehydrogenase-like beta-hydroxyacid dehydrogenase
MTVRTVGILSPGEMGGAVGGALREGGLDVVTCLSGRSEPTRASSAAHGFREVPDLEALVRESDLVLSILVPARAPEVVRSVAAALEATGASASLADCNAIAPETVRGMAPEIERAGGSFIDAGIIGGPPRAGYAPRFYASGPDAHILGELDGRGIAVVPIGVEIGRASAVKMCYAAGTKGTTALQTALLVAAERLGVFEELRAELLQSQAATYRRAAASTGRLPKVAGRFVGEMEEIAATFESVGVPGGFHRAAADIFRLVASADLDDTTGSDEDSLPETVAALAAQTGS